MNEWFLLFIHCWGWCCCVWGVWFWKSDVTYFLHFEQVFNFWLLRIECLFSFLLFFLTNQQVRMVTNEPNIVDFCTNIGESCTNIGEILSKLVDFCTNIGGILSFSDWIVHDLSRFLVTLEKLLLQLYYIVSSLKYIWKNKMPTYVSSHIYCKEMIIIDYD